MRSISYKNKIISQVQFNLVDFSKKEKLAKHQTSKNFVDFLIEKIFSTSTGYAGYKTKSYLKNFILRNIFNSENNGLIKLNYVKLSEEKIFFVINETIKKSYDLLPCDERIDIFVFPTFKDFVKEKMFGVEGFTPYHNVIHIYIHPGIKNIGSFLKFLEYTLIHEYNHTLRFKYFPVYKKTTLMDTIISEGLAENFYFKLKRKIISPWAKSIDDKQAIDIFKKIEHNLYSANWKLYNSLFFENKDFPLWSGYAIGYQIVKSFIKKNPEVEWPELIRIDACKIFEKSDWDRNIK